MSEGGGDLAPQLTWHGAFQPIGGIDSIAPPFYRLHHEKKMRMQGIKFDSVLLAFVAAVASRPPSVEPGSSEILRLGDQSHVRERLCQLSTSLRCIARTHGMVTLAEHRYVDGLPSRTFGAQASGRHCFSLGAGCPGGRPGARSASAPDHFDSRPLCFLPSRGKGTGKSRFELPARSCGRWTLGAGAATGQCHWESAVPEVLGRRDAARSSSECRGDRSPAALDR